jgi:hypothetical protein
VVKFRTEIDYNNQNKIKSANLGKGEPDFQSYHIRFKFKKFSTRNKKIYRDDKQGSMAHPKEKSNLAETVLKKNGMTDILGKDYKQLS